MDFGCGNGSTVREARDNGLDVVGCDSFAVAIGRVGLDGEAVHEIKDGKIPFNDDSFDSVYSNQVFEHIEDIETALAEIHRVLKPDGKFRLAFPVKNCLYEGHVLVPLIPWFDGKPRWYALYLLRLLGLGRDEFLPIGPGEKPLRDAGVREWADYAHEHLNKYVFYHTRASALRSFQRYFSVRPIEHEYVSFRLGGRRLFLFWPVRVFARIAVRLLRTDVMECLPKTVGEPRQ